MPNNTENTNPILSDRRQDYRSKFTGDEIDWALQRMYEFDITTNGCIKLKSDENDPYNLNVLLSTGNYVVYYFEGGSEVMQTVKPLRISVTYLNEVLTQIAIIMDCVQFRCYIDEEWTEWESWYTTGYIYQQPDPPKNPQKNAIWIDTSDPENPVLMCWNGTYWIEVRPSDVMDITIYDPEKKMTDIFKYIDDRIEEWLTNEDGESFYELYRIHVADNTIHFTRSEKKELMAKPSEKELREEIANVTAEKEKEMHDAALGIIKEVEDIAGQIETDSGRMQDHFDDNVVHVTPEKQEEWSAKADGNHTHIKDGHVKITTDDIISGIFKESQIPAVAQEIVCKVENDVQRFNLTKNEVQNGDTVCVKNGNTGTGSIFYYVVDDTNLDSEEGYQPYAALLAQEIPFEHIINRPTTRDGYGITDVPTYDEMQDIWEKDDTITTTYISTIFSRSTTVPKITGHFTVINSNDFVETAHIINDNIMFLTVENIITESENNFIFHIKKFNVGDMGYQFGMDKPYANIEGEEIAEIVVPRYWTTLPGYRFTGGNKCPMYEANPNICCIDYAITEGEDAKYYLDIYGYDKMYVYNPSDMTLLSLKNPTGKVSATSYNCDIYLVNINGNVIMHSTMEDKVLLQNPNLDIICECNIKNIGHKDFTFIHNQNTLVLLPLDSPTVDRLTSFADYPDKLFFGNDAIILQTEIFEGEMYVLYLQAVRDNSSLDPSWIAYHTILKIARVDFYKNSEDTPIEMTHRDYEIKEYPAVVEIGSADRSLYIQNLKERYLSHYDRAIGDGPKFFMAYSNSCIIVFQDDRPLTTLGFMNWGIMFNKKIDSKNGLVSETNTLAQTTRRVIYNGNDQQSLIHSFEENNHYVSFDGYNFYKIDDDSNYTPNFNGLNYTDSKIVVVSKTKFIILVRLITAKGSVINHGIVLTSSNISEIVDESLDIIDDAISKSSGSITSNAEYKQINEYVGSPVTISGADNRGIVARFADYSEPNPLFYIDYHYEYGMRRIKMFTSFTNAPEGWEDFYIKGGYYQSSQYLFILFTFEDSSPVLSLGIAAGAVINILYTNEISIYDRLLVGDRDKFITSVSFKTYMIGRYIYGYMEYSKKGTVTGFAQLATYMLIKCDYGMGSFEIIYPRFNDAFYTDGRLTSAIRAYLLNDKIYVIRCNATYFTVIMYDAGDYDMRNNYMYQRLIPDIFNTIWERNIPEPFILNGIFTIGYTDKAGNLVLAQIPETGNFVITDTEIQVVNIEKDGKEQYNALYDESSHSMLMINVYKDNEDGTGVYHTRDILSYFVYDEKNHDMTGILYMGKISNSILSGYTVNGVEFRFPDIVRVSVNYTTILLAASFFDKIEEDDSVFGKCWPILRIVIDSGTETLGRVYSLTSQYVRKISDYEEKFLSLRNQISSCEEYADRILEIIG